MGVANRHSIAWNCVESFLAKGYDCLITHQTEARASKMDSLRTMVAERVYDHCESRGRILAMIPCDVTVDLPHLFRDQIPDVLASSERACLIDCVVHSIAHAKNIQRPMVDTALEDYMDAHHVSAYSLLETIRCSRDLIRPDGAAFVTLSYLGSQRAVPGYGIMGSAKASLEALVRGLAAENGPDIRCNAVSAGPLRTAAARGIPNFSRLHQHVGETNALKRNVTPQEVADAVLFLAEATGITGQVLYVDGGYNSLVPVM